MRIQENVVKMSHIDIEITGLGNNGHTHLCNFCERSDVPCLETYYVRRKNLSDTVLCETCASMPDLQKLFPKLPDMLRIQGRSMVQRLESVQTNA